MGKIYDCIVIGSGVSGMTASIYLKRAALDILLLEKSMPGGQITQTGMIENYPGFIGDGSTLALTMYDQVKENEVNHKFANVLKIQKTDKAFKIMTSSEEYETKKIILATGRTPNHLNLENEEQLIGRGVSYCAICDGPLYKNKTVAVVGSGNSALEEGIYLSSICKKVIFINRSEKFKGSKVYIEKLKTLNNIEILYNTSIVELLEENNQLAKVKLSNTNYLEIDGLFVYIGFTPDTKYLEETDVKTENQYVLTDENGKTNVEGIYACGDVIKKNFYQISTAVGEGAKTALQVIRDFESH